MTHFDSRFLFFIGHLALVVVAKAADPPPAQKSTLAGRAAEELKQADADGDGRLSAAEFSAAAPEKDRAERARRFRVFDFDGDGALNAAEFGAAIAPTDERGEIPDPMAEMRRDALAKWETLLAEADQDGDKALSKREWPRQRIADEMPAIAEATFESWDRDGNGAVDLDEAGRLLDAAYGLARLDGGRLRTPAGRVFSWYYFRHLDENADGVVSYEEFVARHHSGKEKNAAIFYELDVDADRHSVRAFDADGDGKLSFREFRGTTFANQASGWAIPRRDADGDGRLSFAEFYTEKSPLLAAQGRWFFDRFDADKDGFLSLDELEFDVSIDKVPPETLFKARDINGDGQLALTEVFTDKRPTGGEPGEAARFETRLAAAENRFLADDRDSSGGLDLDEFIASQQAAIEAARRQSKILDNRKTMLEGNYWVRKGVLVVNEIAFLAIVWLVVRKTR